MANAGVNYRTNFVRAVSRFFLATPRHLIWLDGLVKAVIVLNLLDVVFTLIWVGAGHAEEANLLLVNLVREHPVAFVLTKISLVSLGLAVVGIFSIFMVYYFVLLYHLHYTSVVMSS